MYYEDGDGGMRVIVTGASGFVGRWLIKALKEAKHQCTAIIRPEQKSVLKSDYNFMNVGLVCLEMKEYDLIGSIVPDSDCLINLAWDGSRGADRMNPKIQENNYLCTLKAIKSMQNTSCKCIVTAGSQAEYGLISGKIKETTKPEPNTEYGKYKLKLYEDARDICERIGIRLIEPRFFSLYGPYDTEKTLIISILRRMLLGKICNLTKSVQMWDFLYIEDAMEALISLIISDASGGVYNFASGDCRMLKSFIEEMKTVSGSSSFINYGAVPYPSSGMVSIEPDISKLINTIGWSPRTSFNEGIKKVIMTL